MLKQELLQGVYMDSPLIKLGVIETKRSLVEKYRVSPFLASGIIAEFMNTRLRLDKRILEAQDVFLIGEHVLGMTPIELVRKVREFHPYVPIVLVCSNTSDNLEQYRMMKRHGLLNDLISMPLDMLQLVEIIKFQANKKERTWQPVRFET